MKQFGITTLGTFIIIIIIISRPQITAKPDLSIGFKNKRNNHRHIYTYVFEIDKYLTERSQHSFYLFFCFFVWNTQLRVLNSTTF